MLILCGGRLLLMADRMLAGEVEFRLHSPYRDILPPRDLPAGAEESAPATFVDHGEELAYRLWLDGGCELAGAARVDEDGWWVTREVEILRDRTVMAAGEKRFRAAARRQGLFVRPPPVREGEGVPDDPAVLLAYGRRVAEESAAAGRPVQAKSDEELRSLGADRWRRFVVIARRLPVWGEVVRAAERSYWRRLPHAEFWLLVADARPVVISATSGRLIDGARRLAAHAAAGRRSPGVWVVRREYADDAAELEDVVRLNAANPALSPVDRVRLAECLRPAYRAEAARNSGRPGGEFTDLSSRLPTRGRRSGRRLKRRKAGAPVRVAERLADAAGMSRLTYEKYGRLLNAEPPTPPTPPGANAARYWRRVGDVVALPEPPAAWAAPGQAPLAA